MKFLVHNRIAVLLVTWAGLLPTLAMGAEEAAGGNALAYLGAALGAGLIVIGAALGIGRFAAAAAESTARQPEAAADIRAAVNLPLFLLEGVAIIALVVCLLIALK